MATASPAAKEPGYGQVQADAPLGGFRSWQEYSKENLKLTLLADQILAASGTGALSASSGYSTMSIDTAQRRIDLYWKGVLPPSVGAVVRAVRKSASVAVHSAPYTAAALDLAARTIMSGNSAYTDFGGTDVTSSDIASASPDVNGSGLDVTLLGGSPARLGHPDAASTAGLPTTMTRVNGIRMPVDVSYTGTSPMPLVSRTSDPASAGW